MYMSNDYTKEELKERRAKLRLTADTICEKNWGKGFHLSKNGKKIKLKNMDIHHLKNTILWFEDCNNVESLEKELVRRSILSEKQEHNAKLIEEIKGDK